MTVNVVTISICDRCKVKDTRQGACGEKVPSQWAIVHFTGAYNHAPGYSLCFDCNRHVKATITEYEAPA